MVTKKVVESASETDDETEVAPKAEVQKTVNKKEVIFPPSTFLLAENDSHWYMSLSTNHDNEVNNSQFQISEEAPAAKKQKVVAPGAKKQQGIASFFQRK